MSILARSVTRLIPGSASRKLGPIGIDFGLEAVHLVQLESVGGEAPQVRARASMAFESPRAELLESPHQFRSLMKRALGADRFQGRKAVIAIPSGMFRTLSINYRLAAGDEDEAGAVLGVMKDRLDGDLSDYVLDYLPVKSHSKNDERLAFVAVSERQPIVKFLELLRKTGLDVEALEIGPAAICRLVGAMSVHSGSRNVLVINSGRRASYLTLISGDNLLFDQEVTFGENTLIRQAAETLDMADEMVRDLVMRTGVKSTVEDSIIGDALDEPGLVNTLAEILKPQFLKLVDEIKRVCLYAAAETRGGAVSQIYLLGSIARWPGSDGLLSHLTGFDVAKIPDPLALFPQNEKPGRRQTPQPAPEIAVATGAALRGIHGDA